MLGKEEKAPGCAGATRGGGGESAAAAAASGDRAEGFVSLLRARLSLLLLPLPLLLRWLFVPLLPAGLAPLPCPLLPSISPLRNRRMATEGRVAVSRFKAEAISFLQAFYGG